MGATNLPLQLLRFLRRRRLRPAVANISARHVIEAHRLRQKYGPAFDHIKGRFLALDDERLTGLLDAYGTAHGKGARRYAAATVAKWRGGQVTMAGQTMTRLFDLLPRVMTPDEKLALIKDLRAQTLTRLHRQSVSLQVSDRRDLVTVAQQVLTLFQKSETSRCPQTLSRSRAGWVTATLRH